MIQKPKTIFCDIDGTLCEYPYTGTKNGSYDMDSDMIPLEGTLKKLWEWDKAGHMIILTTARPEDMREHTINELVNNYIQFDRLIMGIERGPRYIINDMDPNKPGERAIAINLKRDEGI